jgi:hypothetical protein
MNNVTLIDDLPTLEELDFQQSPGIGMIPPNEANKYQKFIRNSGFTTPPQSGMNISSNNKQKIKDYRFNENQFQNMGNEYQPYYGERFRENFGDPTEEKEENEEASHKHRHGKYRPGRCEPDININCSCIDVAEHTENCLVCSKLYTNNNTVYIIMIIFLAVVNLLLLKRILETGN